MPASTFIATGIIWSNMQVLQVPVVKARVVKKLLAGVAPRVPLLANSSVPTSDDTLEQFLQHVGVLFGRDPNKWEKVGDTKTDITEQNGKRIIKRTGMFTGTELHLFVTPPYYDPRLPLRPDQPQLEFAVQSKEVTSTAEWQQVSLVRRGIAVKRLQQLAECGCMAGTGGCRLVCAVF